MTDSVLRGPRPAPPPALVILGVLAGDPGRARQVAERLGATHGGVALQGPIVPFDETDYYAPEMGPGLVRFYCAFRRLLPAERLPDLKTAAWELEQEHLVQGRRTVNLDPGYLDHTRVVLASFKHGPQKLYLGRGVWADLVLFYQDGRWTRLPWTFPDLRGGAHAPFFVQARRRYRELLREARKSGAHPGGEDPLE